MTEEGGLGPQDLDVGAGLASACEHEHGLDQDLAPVVDDHARRDGLRETSSQAHPVGEGTQGVQANVGHNTTSSGFHQHGCGAVSVHLRSALLFGYLHLRQAQFRLAGGLLRGCAPFRSCRGVKNRG